MLRVADDRRHLVGNHEFTAPALSSLPPRVNPRTTLPGRREGPGTPVRGLRMQPGSVSATRT